MSSLNTPACWLISVFALSEDSDMGCILFSECVCVYIYIYIKLTKCEKVCMKRDHSRSEKSKKERK